MRTAALIPLLAASGAHAWGQVGHATVATIADHYLTDSARSWVSSILGNGVTMASVASWADSFRYTKGGRWSAPLHFIDAEDSPPSSCSVDFGRDCGAGGCSISAIGNYSSILLQEADQDSLKFLIHFLGDVTQPLHDEAEKVGGNEIKVTWDGTATNLHSCWDTQMVEKAAGGSERKAGVVDNFAQSLITEIESGDYQSQAASWISCIDPTNAQTCALQWAQDANAFNCQYVLLNDETNQELDGDYYTGAKPIFLLQIAKAGYRLGHFLNNLAAASASGSGSATS